MDNCTPKQTVTQAPQAPEQIACEYARVLGVTPIPKGKSSVQTGRVTFCQRIFIEVDKLLPGQALMVEFNTKRDTESTRTTIWKLAEYLELPYTCVMMDTILWVFKRQEVNDDAKI
jgi:hypothetical protein